MKFTLNTAFNDDDLRRIFVSGSNVVVAKANGENRPNVAWVVFRPLEANRMTWEEKYGIYASNTELATGGAILNQVSRTEYPAESGNIYTLRPEGFFGAPIPGAASGSFGAANQYDNLPKGLMTFGLFQDAEVNSKLTTGNAVSAAAVAYTHTATITPYTSVYLWIQSSVESNSVVTVVTSPMTEVRFGGAVTTASLAYDAKSGHFVTVADDGGSDVSLTRHEPSS